MAIYRSVQLSFWTDPKVEDDFTPEDKYFYLYLLTNPHTNLAGCYEISNKQLTSETGYSKETIDRLLNRFKTVHQLIDYEQVNKEILLINWHKHNWTSSPKFIQALESEINGVKTPRFKEYLENLIEKEDTVYIPYPYPMDTTVTVTVTDTVSVTDSNTDTVNDIIDYLNLVTNSNYRYKTASTRKLVKSRMKEGYTVDDFKTVIDKKYEEWKGTSMEQYLRPETLFGTKFEGYLNQKVVKQTSNNAVMDAIKNRVDIVDEWV